MDTQEISKPAGKTTAKKKGAKLPLKAKVLKRRFSMERPHETALAIALVCGNLWKKTEATKPVVTGFPFRKISSL